MRIIAPNEWEDGVKDFLIARKIDAVYARYPPRWLDKADFFKPGRANEKKMAGYIQEFKKQAIDFNLEFDYLCFNNDEFTRRGYRNIFCILEWFADSGVDSITVGSPYIFEILKKNFPRLSIGVSQEAHVDGIRRAQYWETMGADFIILPSVSVNRDFRLLGNIRASVKCKLYLFAHSPCLNKCPYGIDCPADVQCPGQCRDVVYGHPEYLLSRGTWIRPEDIDYYASLGIDGIWLLPDRLSGEGFSVIRSQNSCPV